jgi:hypothetical protein
MRFISGINPDHMRDIDYSQPPPGPTRFSVLHEALQQDMQEIRREIEEIQQLMTEYRASFNDEKEEQGAKKEDVVCGDEEQERRMLLSELNSDSEILDSLTRSIHNVDCMSEMNNEKDYVSHEDRIESMFAEGVGPSQRLFLALHAGELFTPH